MLVAIEDAKGQIHSVAVDGDDKLYVMAYNGGLKQNMDTLRVFAPDGSYLRTLIPFAADPDVSRPRRGVTEGLRDNCTNTLKSQVST